jgi:outer membrane immunogenic protein
MKKLILAVSMLAASTVGAFAADLAAKPVYTKAPVIVAPAYNWSGFYLGATVGDLFGKWSYTNSGGFASASNNIKNGLLGGPTVGYNWQTGPIVLGLEGDYSWTDANSIDLSGCSAPGCQNNYKYFATARGRIGYAFDRFMPYFTGGAAFTQTHDTYLPTVSDDGGKSISGWTVGGGLEWAFWNDWSAKIEYLHADFGKPVIFAPSISINLQHDDSNLNVVRVGINYKFGWGGPVVAKY